MDAESVLKKIVAVVDGLGEAPSHDEAIDALDEIRELCVGHAGAPCSACTHPRSMHRPDPMPRHASRTSCLGKTDSLWGCPCIEFEDRR